MAVQTKAIKKRINSVKNIKKITRAMEMVAASKMKRAVEQALDTRAYAEVSLEFLVNLSYQANLEHLLLEQRELKNILAVVITSNKGLCGSYNNNIFKEVRKAIDSYADCNIEFITIGKKAEKLAKKLDKKLLASFIDISDKPSFEEILPISNLTIQSFKEKKYDEVLVIYTDFVSAIKQVPCQRPLLPISQKTLRKMLANLGKESQDVKASKDSSALYLFEPSSKEVLEKVLPRLTEMQLFQSLLEANASEHSARMMAMKNASSSASDMIDELTLSFNQARQASITQEIAEISSGAAALTK
jgi:F-type H+-transporting ATPase subunit gamma